MLPRPRPAPRGMCSGKTLIRRFLDEHWREGRRTEVGAEFATAAAFALLAIGTLAGIPPAIAAGRSLFLWWAFELLGAVFLTFLFALLDGTSLPHRPAWQKGIVVSGSYLVMVVVISLVFPRIPLAPMLAAGLLLLPGHIIALIASAARARTQLILQGAVAFVSLPISFFAVALLASIGEAAGLAKGQRELFDGTVSLLWGVCHFALKAFMGLTADRE